MACGDNQEVGAQRLQSLRRQWRGSALAAISVVVLFLAWQAAPANAAGAIYAVPSEPPSEKDSVDFANAINQRVRNLPPPLDPPTAESPAVVEARIRTLERGVVIEGGESRSGPRDRPAQKDRPARPQADSGPGDETAAAPGGPVEEPGDRPPLSMAFVAAGILALLGLLLGAGRKLSGPTGPA